MNLKSAALKYRAFDLDVKEVQDSGRFSGYGSVFHVVDSYNEIVAPGAFAQSLDDVRAKGRTFPVLWQHMSQEPIGSWDISTMREDEHGLFGEADLWLDEAPNARVAQRGMKTKAITGLSIGYYVRNSAFDEKTRIRTLLQLDLVEISIVTSPANDEARIDQIKAKLAHGAQPTIREFEDILRDAGFSKAQAAVIAARGYREPNGRVDPGVGDSKGKLIEALRGFSLGTIPNL